MPLPLLVEVSHVDGTVPVKLFLDRSLQRKQISVSSCTALVNSDCLQGLKQRADVHKTSASLAAARCKLTMVQQSASPFIRRSTSFGSG